jgi:hypothetical protein
LSSIYSKSKRTEVKVSIHKVLNSIFEKSSSLDYIEGIYIFYSGVDYKDFFTEILNFLKPVFERSKKLKYQTDTIPLVIFLLYLDFNLVNIKY